MILTGDDIKQYIAYGSLSFSPVLSSEQYQQNGVDLILQESEIVSLKKGDFTLASTREWIHVPNDLMAFVQLRSSWARRGIIIPPTVIDAGFSGTITLEIAAFCDIELPLGERFAHIIFSKLCTPTQPYNGKYQFQRGITKFREEVNAAEAQPKEPTFEAAKLIIEDHKPPKDTTVK